MRGKLSKWAKKLMLAGLLLGQVVTLSGGVVMAAGSVDPDGYIYNSAKNVRYEYDNPTCQLNYADVIYGPYLEQLCNYYDGDGLYSDVGFTKKISPVTGNPKQIDITLEAKGPIDKHVVPDKAGENAVAFDRISNSFTFVEPISGAGGMVLSGDGKSVSCNLGIITETGTSCAFRVELNYNSDVCQYVGQASAWFDTNVWSYNNGQGTQLTYDPFIAGGGTGQQQHVNIVSNPQYEYKFLESDFANCSPGRIDIVKAIEDEYGNPITNNEQFTANVKIVTNNTTESPYQHSYRLDAADPWTPYTSAGIDITITNGRMTTIYLNDISAGSATGYKAIVTEQTPGQANYYCYQMQCTGQYFDVDNDATIDNTVVNVYAPPVPGTFSVSKTVENALSNARFNNKTFYQDQNYTFYISIDCKDVSNLPYGVTCSHDAPASVTLKHGESSPTYTINDLRGIQGGMNGITVTEDEDLLISGYTLDYKNDFDFFNLYTYSPIDGKVIINKRIILNNPLHSALIDPLQTFEFKVKIETTPGFNIYYNTNGSGVYDKTCTADIDGFCVITVFVMAGRPMVIEFEDISDIINIDITEVDDPTDAWHLVNTNSQSDQTHGEEGVWTFENKFIPTCLTHPSMDGCLAVPYTGIGTASSVKADKNSSPFALAAILVTASMAVCGVRRLSSKKK